MLSIDRASNRERAAVGAVRMLDRTLAKRIREATRDQVVPLAVRAAVAAADTPTMARIVATGRYSEWRRVPGVGFGGTRQVTSTGARGRDLVRGLEYGSPGTHEALFTRRTPSGGTARVARRSSRQFMPDRSANPTTVTPAMEAIADQVLELWTDLVEQAFTEAWG